MKSLSLQNRIAVYYIVSLAALTAILCVIILFVIQAHTVRNEQAAYIETYAQTELLMTILMRVCIVGFCFIMAILFVISRYIAQRSIKPIQDIIDTAASITHSNLSARIPLPTHRDELYTLSTTINDLLDRLQEAINREKSFTSYASHEFRTPLAVIKGTMEVLIRRPRTPQVYEERIATCIAEVDRLNNMVQQLLLLTRLEEGRSNLVMTPCNLHDLIAETLRPYSARIEEKQLQISINIPTHQTLLTDRSAMSTILTNLLSNAVHYTPQQGNISLQTTTHGRNLVFSVCNSGPGIPQAEQENIFGRFYRLPASSATHPQGHGLGLSIVKNLCALLNVDISLQSETGKGVCMKMKGIQSVGEKG